MPLDALNLYHLSRANNKAAETHVADVTVNLEWEARCFDTNVEGPQLTEFALHLLQNLAQ
jgi:hypothetical protein